MAKIKFKQKGYNWQFVQVGGMTRVNITKGEDIAHLDELDKKLWTVLSCPVSGLEFNERTLALMDSDGDGKIRVDEVISASQWLRNILKDLEVLFDATDRVDLHQLRTDNADGKAVEEACRMILEKLGRPTESISLTDITDYKAIIEERIRAEYQPAEQAVYAMPYGDKSDAVEAAVTALRDKVADYYLRCRLAAFDTDATAALDVQVDKIAAISTGNLTSSMDDIASYPLARPRTDALLPLSEGINPAWQSHIDVINSVAVAQDFDGCTTLSAEQWDAIVAKTDAYTAWKQGNTNQENETINAQLETHTAAIHPAERLVLYCRDFVKLVHNYITFSDFYSRNEKTLSIFQAGKLFIDQRQCDLCLKVTDMGKHAAMGSLSGIYLIYCHCVSKVKGQEMDIVAALTDGDVDDLREGKNAIFYDRNGQDWDATVTKIIDNPISVRQAFWSPYRKFGNWVSDKITKSAEEKESKQFDEMTSKADTATANLATTNAEGEAAKDASQKPATPFDIAKFAGIFAAIGLAFGAIGGALASLGKFVMLKWYNVILLVAAVVLIISGPSMFLAWLKLRKRNLGPVLNANGWAINSKVKINTAFGATLTSIAQYPKLVMNDPFADKKTPWWKKLLWWLLVIVIAAFCVLYFTKNLPWQKKDAEAAVDKETATAVADTTAQTPTDTTAVVVAEK
ncbi:MAG: hypothetical protein IJ761_01320 [Bacteroidales bacterium]|nr:hypothetical protein [Bacteroidales bacterium]